MIPRKRFGQHFLRDETILNSIVSRIRPQKGEEMLEIGPGDGALTGKLLQAGAALTAVEIDRDLAAKLRAKYPALRLIVGDAMREDLAAILQNGMRVAGNLPYNISTQILIRLSECRPREMWLMLQKEVAARLCAMPGMAEYGRLTASVRLRYKAAAELSAPPEAFYPPPKVHSAVVKLVRRENPPPHSELFSAIVSAAFQSRRKILANGLSGFVVDWRAANVDPLRRPQTLSPDEFARLSVHSAVREGGNSPKSK